MIIELTIESLDQEGRGVAHADGKVIFIQGALPGELVTYASYSKKPSYEIAQVTRIVEPAPMPPKVRGLVNVPRKLGATRSPRR